MRGRLDSDGEGLIRHAARAKAGQQIASPERELEELRERQKKGREKAKRVEQRMKDREKKIAETKQEAQVVERLERAGVKLPWPVLLAADRAADANDAPENEFRAMCLVVLKKETGVPQRNIFGCDHGSVGDQPPYCHQAVTPARGRAQVAAVHRAPFTYMNGVSWTQTTWYEKLFRVEKIDADVNDPRAHMQVCFGDLALLRDAYGVREAFRRYNGSGPAAEAYATAAMNLLSWANNLIRPN